MHTSKVSRASTFPKIYGPVHGIANNNQILRGDQTICEENFDKVDRECGCMTRLQYVLVTVFLFQQNFVVGQLNNDNEKKIMKKKQNVGLWPTLQA